jgi:hypothetical protein
MNNNNNNNDANDGERKMYGGRYIEELSLRERGLILLSLHQEKQMLKDRLRAIDKAMNPENDQNVQNVKK